MSVREALVVSPVTSCCLTCLTFPQESINTEAAQGYNLPDTDTKHCYNNYQGKLSNIYTQKKKDKDRREGKGRHCCLGDVID